MSKFKGLFLNSKQQGSIIINLRNTLINALPTDLSDYFIGVQYTEEIPRIPTIGIYDGDSDEPQFEFNGIECLILWDDEEDYDLTEVELHNLEHNPENYDWMSGIDTVMGSYDPGPHWG